MIKYLLQYRQSSVQDVQASGPQRLERLPGLPLGLPTHEPRDILLILLAIIKFHPDALGPRQKSGKTCCEVKKHLIFQQKNWFQHVSTVDDL